MPWLSSEHCKFLLQLTCLLVLAFQLSACRQGSPPTESFEYALQGLYSATLSEDGELALVGSINHGGSLWNFIDNERIYNWNHKQGEFSQIISSAISPEQNWVVTATPQTLVLWNAQTGAGLNYWTAPSEILDVALLPDAALAVLGLVDHSVALFDVKNGGVREVFYHDRRVNSVAYSAATRQILSGSEDYSARLWEVGNAAPLHRWDHEDEVQLVELSPDGSIAFTMAKYDKAALWDTVSGEMLAQMPLKSTAIRRGSIYTAAAISGDNELLLTGNNDRLVQLWALPGATLVKSWQMPKRDAVAPTSASVLDVAFGTRGNYYAVTSDGFAHKLR